MFSLFEQFVNKMSVWSLKALGTINEVEAENLQTVLDQSRVEMYGGTPVEIVNDVSETVSEAAKEMKKYVTWAFYGIGIFGILYLVIKLVKRK